jgi:hypothetical protein
MYSGTKEHVANLWPNLKYFQRNKIINNEEMHNLCYAKYVIREIKSMRIKWGGQVA